jgi:hypothetical protein
MPCGRHCADGGLSVRNWGEIGRNWGRVTCWDFIRTLELNSAEGAARFFLSSSTTQKVRLRGPCGPCASASPWQR